ncbi:conserved hypothetical protein [Candidatus Desulfosporosinus infrequens]|uniref:Uncharacterized protein n=1 Tax=Candidatus Desulfosporosinus infrequens TaxID=2043169 RepID=A0A2U3LNE3_9FIRM|nr:conserved hypothetical protein [Candidatus Desulfosporosinus infrequens]
MIVLLLAFSFIVQNWIARYFEYQCRKCEGKFSLPTWKAILSVHIMGRKYVKCPNCGKWGWVSSMPKGLEN